MADALSRNPPEDQVSVNIVDAINMCTTLPTELQSAHCDQHVSNMDRKVWLEANSENVTSSVLPSYSHSVLSNMQKEDFALRETWSRWKRRWDPGQDELPGPGTTSAEIKGWLKEWSRFVEQHGVLYRSIEEPGLGRVYQLLVPKRLRTLIV